MHQNYRNGGTITMLWAGLADYVRQQGGQYLAGCASVPPEPPAARYQVRDFTLEARFALRVSLPDRAPESSGGRLDWEHKNGRDRILIANPLGVGVAEIETGPTLSILRTGDGRQHGRDDGLVERGQHAVSPAQVVEPRRRHRYAADCVLARRHQGARHAIA
mgnify:CR=1 FL=1